MSVCEPPVEYTKTIYALNSTITERDHQIKALQEQLRQAKMEIGIHNLNDEERRLLGLPVYPNPRCKIWHDDFGCCELPFDHDGWHARTPGGSDKPNIWAPAHKAQHREPGIIAAGGWCAPSMELPYLTFERTPIHYCVPACPKPCPNRPAPRPEPPFSVYDAANQVRTMSEDMGHDLRKPGTDILLPYMRTLSKLADRLEELDDNS